MRAIGIALHDYQDRNGRLPPAVVYGKDGKPLLSWRVALLPYIDQEALYKEFNLDEPWDSPHNIRLLPRMPATYGPFDKRAHSEPGYTYFQVFVGKGTAFEDNVVIHLPKDFTDGSSNTILVAEAGKAVPWTKPEDLPYAAEKPLPSLGGITKDGFRVAMGDASARAVDKKMSESTIRAAITRNGGDVLGSDW